MQRDPFAPLYLLEGVRQIREAVRMPVICMGGPLSLYHREEALHPEEIAKSDCDQRNRCIATMDAAGSACVGATLSLVPHDAW